MEASDDDPSGTKVLIEAGQKEATQRAKNERKARKKAEKAESLELAKKRKKKDVKLNSNTSLSNLTSLTGRQDKVDSRACHRCGAAGHLMKDCPSGKRPFPGGEDDGPPRKARKAR